ncbi:MAG: serine hydrolase [Bacilli bacterium]|nr:serine hydrolase [Bacilli bacterium]
MKNKLMFFLIIISILIGIPYVDAERIRVNDVSIYNEDINLELKSKNVILYNLDNKVKLYELNSDEKVQIASLTKIMTVYVLAENIKDLKKEVTISAEVFNDLNGYVQAGLKVGDKVSFEDLLYGIMLPSGADCVNAAIIGSGLSKDKFIELMNNTAKELKLNNTHFDNAIGMDSKGNYSTAKDLSKLLMKALDNDVFKKVYTTKKYTMSNGLKLNSTLISYGRTLDTDNVIGAKSGFTDGAGVCLASIAEYNKTNYLLIVLGASSLDKSNAIRDSLSLYNYYNDNYSYKKIFTKNQLLKKINIKWGKKKKYVIKSNKNIEIYLNNKIEPDDIEYSYKGVKELNYKIKKGDKLGTVTAKSNGKVLNVYDVYLDEKIDYYHPVLYTIMVISLLGIISSIYSIFNKKKTKKKRRKKRRKRKKRK